MPRINEATDTDPCLISLEGVWLLRQEAEKRIEEILEEVWGEE